MPPYSEIRKTNHFYYFIKFTLNIYSMIFSVSVVSSPGCAHPLRVGLSNNSANCKCRAIFKKKPNFIEEHVLLIVRAGLDTVAVYNTYIFPYCQYTLSTEHFGIKVKWRPWSLCEKISFKAVSCVWPQRTSTLMALCLKTVFY